MKTFLKEGGNVFKTADGLPATQRIEKGAVLPTVQWLEKVTGLSLSDNMLGTTGKKESSGDLDLAVDESVINKNVLADRLAAWATRNKLHPNEYVKKSGISVHFKTPILGDPVNGYVQTDFMFTNKLNWTKFVLSSDPASAYKGALRNILINSMAKSMGYKLNQNTGLQDRATNEVITDNPNELANILVGPGATAESLSSVESIVAALKNDPKKEDKIADFKQHLAREGMPFHESVNPGSSQWFRHFTNYLK